MGGFFEPSQLQTVDIISTMQFSLPGRVAGATRRETLVDSAQSQCVHKQRVWQASSRYRCVAWPLLPSLLRPGARAAVMAPAAPEAPAEQEQQQSPVCEPETGPGFASLGVDQALLAGLAALSIHSPSAIQATAIPAILGGSNVAIQSYTGSGKTLAYLLPVLNLAIQRAEAIYRSGDGREVPIQAVIVCPSQELAMQVVRVAQSLLPPAGKNMVQQCIGGANPRHQLTALQKNKPIVVIGTPGRLADFMQSGALRVHYTSLLVLDEADQLLAPQFSEDMTALTAAIGKRIGPRPKKPTTDALPTEPTDMDTTSADVAPPSSPAATDRTLDRPESRQTVLVSATLSRTVLTKTQPWCPDPVYVTAGGAVPVLMPVEQQAHNPEDAPDAPGWGWGVRGWDGPASTFVAKGQGSAGGVEGEGLVPSMPPHLKHYVMVVDSQRKVDSVRRAMHAMDLQRSLIFMNWQQRLKDVQFKLEARAMSVAVLHGEMPKVARQNTLNDFTRGRLRALVVSDVVARGLDVPNCDAVFHLELPSSASHYAHRAGRTGRMGAPGSVISVVAENEVWVVEKLANRLGVEIQEIHMSEGQLKVGAALEKRKDKPRSETVKGGDDDSAAKVERGTPKTAPASTAAKVIATTAAQATAMGDKGKKEGQESTAQVSKVVPKGDVPKGAKVVADEKGEYEAIVYDDEDEVEVDERDEEEMEEELKKMRGGGRGGGGRGQAQSGRGRASRGAKAPGSSGLPEFVRGGVRTRKGEGDRGGRGGVGGEMAVKQELRKELEELKAEKSSQRTQRMVARQQQ